MRWKIEKRTDPNIIAHLLNLREIRDKDKFFNTPHPSSLTANEIGLEKKALDSALARIHQAIKKKEQIVVYGDYDVDGITATAIIWETLNNKGANVLPYIPDRKTEGYGFSQVGIEQIMQKHKPALIITVDHGITGTEHVERLQNQGVDVVVSDHHHAPEADKKEKLAKNAAAVVHTTRLSGSGIAYFLTQSFLQKDDPDDEQLALAALGTIADVLPLKEANRQIARHGLSALTKTRRVGLCALKDEAGIAAAEIEPYHVGYILGPRINAAGRIAHALDALRLLCTNDKTAAQSLAAKLGSFNRQRQKLLEQQLTHTLLNIKEAGRLPPLLILADEIYDEGIIGLIAGKLTDRYHRPAIVIAKGADGKAKASARSIEGVNIINLIREVEDLLLSSGGHPLAAGFSLEADSIPTVAEELLRAAAERIDKETLLRVLNIDAEVPLNLVNRELYDKLVLFAPFGKDNSEPLFCSRNLYLDNVRPVGNEGKHLKFTVGGIDAIAFGRGYLLEKLNLAEPVDIAYHIDLNRWNDREILQLKIRDIKQASSET